MNSSEAWWAQQVWVTRAAERAFGEKPQAVFEHEPGLLVPQLTRNLLLCGGPTEHFSTVRKVPKQEELRPIDDLYGIYSAIGRSIEIFVNRIQQDAGTFGAEPAELTAIVRIHECAHAVVHLGVSAEYAHAHLSRFGADGRTAWPDFLAVRGKRHAGITRKTRQKA